MRQDPGLAASPGVRYRLKMEGSGWRPLASVGAVSRHEPARSRDSPAASIAPPEHLYRIRVPVHSGTAARTRSGTPRRQRRSPSASSAPRAIPRPTPTCTTQTPDTQFSSPAAILPFQQLRRGRGCPGRKPAGKRPCQRAALAKNDQIHQRPLTRVRTARARPDQQSADI
jgi:hypothetical protein